MTGDPSVHLIRSIIHVFIVNRRRGETFLTSDAHTFVAEHLVRIPDGLSALVIEALEEDGCVEVLEHSKLGVPSRWVRVE